MRNVYKAQWPPAKSQNNTHGRERERKQWQNETIFSHLNSINLQAGLFSYLWAEWGRHFFLFQKKKWEQLLQKWSNSIRRTRPTDSRELATLYRHDAQSAHTPVPQMKMSKLVLWKCPFILFFILFWVMDCAIFLNGFVNKKILTTQNLAAVHSCQMFTTVFSWFTNIITSTRVKYRLISLQYKVYVALLKPQTTRMSVILFALLAALAFGHSSESARVSPARLQWGTGRKNFYFRFWYYFLCWIRKSKSQFFPIFLAELFTF